MLYTHTWHSGHNMIENSEVLLEKPKKPGDLSSEYIGAHIAGPFGALAGLGLNRAYWWARKKYDEYKAKRDAEKAAEKAQQKTQQNSDQVNSEDDSEKKIKNAQSKIQNDGMFEPEVYKNHSFYKTTIADRTHPTENNFVYLSKSRSGKKAYENFLNYWAEQYKTKKKNVSIEDIDNFIKLVKERFIPEYNKQCLITVPQHYIIEQPDVPSMAKNSDVTENEQTIYYDKNSFDANYAYDIHMSKYKSESADDDFDIYKTSLLSVDIFDTKYTYAFDLPTGKTKPDHEGADFIMAISMELFGDMMGSLANFTKLVEKMVYSEKIYSNVYTVAAPLLRKNSKTAQDTEYNSGLLDGVGVYNSEEEFKKNYVEDYQKLIQNQMGL